MRSFLTRTPVGQRITTTTTAATALCGLSCGPRHRQSSSSEGRSSQATTSMMMPMGERFGNAGYSSTLSTPSFGSVGDIPQTPDLGEVRTEAAKNLSLGQVEGPWIVLAEGLQGELYIHDNGFAFFRPGDKLGQGIGKIELTDAAGIGITTFKLDLELYRYENVATNPPQNVERLSLVGMFNEAVAEKQNYRTLTMTGQLHDGAAEYPPIGVGASRGNFNAAKMTPWDKNAVGKDGKPGANLFWTPKAEILSAYKQLFPNELIIDSHLKRRGMVHHRTAEPLSPTGSGTSSPSSSNSTISSSTTSTPWKQIDLKPYKVGSISDIHYVPNYISSAEEAQMLDHLKRTPQELRNKLDKRTVQEWGCSMCAECNQSFVSDVNMPPWNMATCNLLLQDHIFSPSIFPNNVRVHEYETGEGIAPHVDGPIYVPKVAILSLENPVLMSFYPRMEPYEQPMEHYNDTFRFEGDIAKKIPVQSLILEPRSLLIFDQEAYTHYPHGISAKEVDSLDPELVGPIVNMHLLGPENEHLKTAKELPRKRRVGVTLRNLLPRCNHQPMRQEYLMMNAWQQYHWQTGNLSSHAPPPSLVPSIKRKPSVFAKAASEASPSSVQPLKKYPSPSASVLKSSNGGDGEAEGCQQQQQQQQTMELIGSVNAKLDHVMQSQKELGLRVNELLSVVAQSTARAAGFETEAAQVLNHLSSSVLEVQAQVEECVEKLEEMEEDKK